MELLVLSPRGGNELALSYVIFFLMSNLTLFVQVMLLVDGLVAMKYFFLWRKLTEFFRHETQDPGFISILLLELTGLPQMLFSQGSLQLTEWSTDTGATFWRLRALAPLLLWAASSKRRIDYYSLWLYWYKDAYIILHLKMFLQFKGSLFFLLILTEIKTLSKALKSIVGPRHCPYHA